MSYPKISLLIVVCVFVLVYSSLGQYTPEHYPGHYYVNSIRTWDVKRPITDPAAVTGNTNPAEVQVTTQYVDGLGRPLQTVIRKGSPLQKDMVSMHLYDAMGRESRKYLPYVSEGSDGSFKLSAFPAQYYFYYLNYLNGQGQTWYYDSITYEKSPLNRPVKTMPAGNSWVGASRGVEQSIEMNIANEVRMWNIGMVSAAVPTSGSWYGAGQLYRLVTKDEHGKRIVEYKDKSGAVVLKKVEIKVGSEATLHSHTDWLCTYYIYDDYDNLRWVIQPQGVQLLLAASWAFDNNQLYNSQIAREQCFYYEYDGRKRMIIKKVPGAGKMEMVYDKRDRLVMSRDSALASQGYWSVNKYNQLNQPQFIYLIPNNFTRLHNQDSCHNNINYPTVSEADLLQENYYNNYNWVSGKPGIGTLNTADHYSAFINTSYNTSPEYAQPLIADSIVYNRQTGQRVRVLGTSTFLYEVYYYDEKGRVIQTRSGNITSGGYDINTTQYDFSGQPIRTIKRQEKGWPVARFTKDWSRYTYDHMGRVLSVVKKTGTTAQRTVAVNTYDELGRLKTKVIGDGLETQTFDYNVRGWLLGVNRNALSTNEMTAKFAFELGYDNITPKLNPGTYGIAQYNGNISGMLWRSYGDGQNRKYNFTYDPANRLLKADFTQFSSSTYNLSAGIDFSTKLGDGTTPGSAYDANGNILAMEQKGRKGASSPIIDQLSYTYLNNSNRLSRVSDTAAANSKLGDFNDGNKTGDDYAYDVNGNLILDKNKGITSILYNHLNLPYEILIGGKGKIVNTYDNMGRKWRKQVFDSTGTSPVTTTWLYMGNFVYKNDTIQFYSHEEGRSRYDTSQTTGEANKYHWDYFLKDHLGNVRMVLTEQKDTIRYVPLTFENENYDLQNAIWENAAGGIVNIGNRNSRPVNFGTAEANGSHARLIRKSTGPIGAAKLLKVMAGDRIHTSVDYFYWVTNTDNSGADGMGSLLTSFATSLLSSTQVSTGLKEGALALTGALSGNIFLSNILNANNQSSGSNQAPKAYLNILFFDEQLKPDEEASTVIPVDYLVNSKGTLSRMMANAMEAKKNGYVYVYFSNESETLVYFDNFILTHELGPLREETHYYPFGLTMAGISSKALGKLENRFQFNGGNEFQTKEFSDGSGLDWYDANFRMYDAQIGRFHQIDPLAEAIDDLSPFSFANNNPILLNDPLGLLGDTAILPEVIVPGLLPKPPPPKPSPARDIPLILPNRPGTSPAPSPSPTPSPTQPPPSTVIPRDNLPITTPSLMVRLLGTVGLLLLPLETGSGADKVPFIGHANRNDNTNQHIVYRFDFTPKDGKTPILKYGISDAVRYGTSRPDGQLAAFRRKYGPTVTYKILARTLNRAEAKAIEFEKVLEHQQVWQAMPREQILPRPLP